MVWLLRLSSLLLSKSLIDNFVMRVVASDVRMLFCLFVKFKMKLICDDLDIVAFGARIMLVCLSLNQI